MKSLLPLLLLLVVLGHVAHAGKKIPFMEVPENLDTPEEKFSWAAKSGDMVQAVELLEQYPELDINWRAPRGGFTALHMAVNNGYEDITQLLLNHPDVQVNARADRGFTPLIIASQATFHAPLKALLADSRVDVDLACDQGSTALWVQALKHNYESVQWTLVSGRIKDVKVEVAGTTPLEIAREEKAENVVLVLEAYEKDPKDTVKKLMKDLNITGQPSSSVLLFLLFSFSSFFLLS